METHVASSDCRFCDLLDGFIEKIGHCAMWCNVILIFVIILQVFLRYGLNHGLIVLEELQWHLYAIGIMFGISYAEVRNSHIRVDLLYDHLSGRWKNRWDLFGVLFLLLPFVIVVFYHSLDFVHESWRLHESSDAPLGLPCRWAIKAVIPASFGMLAIASISRSLRIIVSLRRR